MAIKKYQVLKYDDEFKGVIIDNNKEYSLPNTIKGEEVELSIQNGEANLKTVKITSPSFIRAKVSCPIYNECGGCNIMHIDYQEQLKLKTAKIEELFFNTFNQYYQVNPIIGMANPYHYRNKNQIVFKNAKGGKCRIASGFYKENTHNIVDFDTCLIQDEISDKIVKIIKELMLKMHYNAYDEDHQNGLIRHVLIKRSEVTKEIMVVIVTAQEVFPGCQNFVKALIAREKNITTIIQNINQRKTSAVLGDKEKILYGKGYITDVLLDKKFNISAKSFYQVNSASCANLYKEAIRLAGLSKNDVLLDAYCGVGTIGIIASDYVGKVVSVELVKDAVNDAIKNAKMNNIKNIHFFCADASDFIKNLAAKKEKIDVIIMDPPRKGSDERFINAVLKLMPKKVIYISCNPHTLVNDLKYFKGAYSIKAIQPVDMFPHTYHIETIVLLQKTQK